MTIFNAEVRFTGWRKEFHQFVLPRLAVAHPDLTRISTALRNAGVDVWTESPTDDSLLTLPHYSAAGWRIHYRKEFQRLNAWSTDNGAALQAADAPAYSALQGYLTSMPAIGSAFNTLFNLSAYRDGSGNLIQTRITQPHRNALAAAIEAELE